MGSDWRGRQASVPGQDPAPHKCSAGSRRVELLEFASCLQDGAWWSANMAPAVALCHAGCDERAERPSVPTWGIARVAVGAMAATTPRPWQGRGKAHKHSRSRKARASQRRIVVSEPWWMFGTGALARNVGGLRALIGRMLAASMLPLWGRPSGLADSVRAPAQLLAGPAGQRSGFDAPTRPRSTRPRRLRSRRYLYSSARACPLRSYSLPVVFTLSAKRAFRRPAAAMQFPI